MLCRCRKEGIKQYTYGHKVYKFPSDKWTSVNDIRLFKALQSYPDVFDTIHFFDLKPFLSIANKITFKKDLVFTTSKVVADKLNGMAYVRQQAYKPEIGEWVFKILGYSTEDLTAYQNTKNIVNILAHRDLGGIGDIIMTTSVIEEAVKKYTHYKITYACPDQFLLLLENNPFITSLESINSDVTKKDWDVIVDLTSDCIKHEIKHQPDVKLNRVEIFAQKCGLSIDSISRPKIYLSEDEILKAKEELKDFKLKIGLVLKSNASVRNWPYFKELRTLLSKIYPQATFLEFSIKKPTNWRSIKQSYEVYGRDLRKVSALINECDVVISPDTGLAHIAGALRIPTVWLFTHIDGKVRTKNYDNVWICQNTPKNCVSNGVPCWYDIPCSQGEIERKKDPLCSLAIKPEYVVSKVDKILSKPNVSYCVVYKDNEEITKECISRILKYRKHNDEIILVDNGSKNKEFLDSLLKEQQLIVKIRNGKNEGCIIARNQAMKRAKGVYLFVLDNDQYISSVSLHRLMNTEGDVVGVEGWSMDSNGWAFAIDKNYDELAYVGGGGMLVKKKVAEDIDYLDETYAPAWFSDPDFCFKVREKDYSIVHCRNAEIEHLKHKTIFSQTDFDHQKAWKRSHKLFRKKWAGKFGIGKLKESLKIGVIEFNISRMGGRQSTMLQFADYFKSMGHKVKFITYWGVSRGYLSECPKKEEICSYHGLNFLQLTDFDWGMQKYRREGEWPKDYDVFFIASPRWTDISHKTEIPTVVWKIVDTINCPNPEAVLEFWTNSKTVKEKIKNFGRAIHAVQPPYSFKKFRDAARKKREIDIIDVVRYNSRTAKKIDLFMEIAMRFKLSSMLIFLVHDESDLKEIKNLGVPFAYNLSKEDLAKYLGNAKVFFHPSIDESCSISVYEALNAGCFPVVYDVGAVREQLNGNGIIYKTERPKDQEIMTALKYNGDRTEFIVQGTRFDRKNNLDVIAKRLEEIKVQL